MKVLLADDQEIVRIGVKYLILNEYPNAIIHSVNNGVELIEAIKNEDWDMVISDNLMPLKNGFEVLREIRLEHPNLPFIILSGQLEEINEFNALKNGAAGYLYKIDIEETLISTINSILKDKKWSNRNGN